MSAVRLEVGGVVAGAAALTAAIAAVLVLATGAFAAFGMTSTFPVGDTPESVAVGDFNADGDPDLAVANRESDTVSVLLGLPGRDFAPRTDVATGNAPRAVAVGDVDADGHDDLVVARGDARVEVRRGLPGGGFAAGSIYEVSFSSTAIAIGDFNADGDPDLAVTGSSANFGFVSILLGQPGAGFAARASFNVGSAPQSVGVGDFNADGDPDLAVANSDSGNVSVLLGMPGGHFESQSVFFVGASPQGVAVGDFNADGDPDLAVANRFSANVSVLVGRPGGGFASAFHRNAGASPIAVTVGDFNGDGDDDLAVANNVTAGGVSVLHGVAGAGFAAATSVPVGSEPRALVVGNFGGAKHDLAVANEGSDTVSVLFSAPETTITAGPAGLTSDPTPTFEFTASEAGVSFECRVDGVPSACASPYTTATLADGGHTFDVRATDAAGNTDPTPASRTFSVDATPPDTAITAGPTGATADSTPSFSFTSTQVGSSFTCRVDGEPFTTCSSPRIAEVLADGQHTFEVRATDPAGNTDATPATATFTVDTGAPQTTIDSGPDGATGDAAPSFEFSSSEEGSSFACRVDSEAFAACSSPHTTAALADGEHTFDVRATDAAGNTDATVAGRTFIVDTVAPDTTITAGPEATSTDTTPTFSFTAGEEGATFECRVDAAPFAACVSPHTTTVAGGSHTFAVRAIDPVGNVDPTPATRSFRVCSGPLGDAGLLLDGLFPGNRALCS